MHAHVNFFGWASLALVSLIYHVHPQAAQTRLAQWHFWFHNLGLPLFMISLFFLLSGYPSAEPLVGIGAAITFSGILLFGINVLRTVSGTGAAKAPQYAWSEENPS